MTSYAQLFDGYRKLAGHQPKSHCGEVLKVKNTNCVHVKGAAVFNHFLSVSVKGRNARGYCSDRANDKAKVVHELLRGVIEQVFVVVNRNHLTEFTAKEAA